MPATPSTQSLNPGDRIRRILRLLHIWIGLVLCLPLAAIGVTGSILVFEHEIADLFGSETSRRASQGDRRSIDDIVTAAAAKAPAGAQASMIGMPEEAGDPATVRFQRPGATGRAGSLIVHVDPVTLELIETAGSGSLGWLRQAFQLHANLFAGRDGRVVVGWFGVVMLGLGITGIVLWWPRPGRWRRAFTVDRNARGVRFHRELHGVVGIWGLVVFIIVSFSGVYITFPQTTGEIIRTFLPARDLRAAAAMFNVVPVQGMSQIGLERAVALANAEVPDGTLRAVIPPARPDQPIRVTFTMPGRTGHGVPVISAFVDPWLQQPVEVLDPRTYSAGETVMVWQRALHGGAGLGWIYKILVFASGLMPVVFAVTGIAMWWLKRRRRKEAMAQVPAE